jgi:heme-degrading monooxygenase HmoA
MANEHSGSVYRIDKFRVPRGARAEFLARVRSTHDLLRSLPGCTRDCLLEQQGGPGSFNFVTVVVWENSGAMESARKTVAARHQEAGFDPNAFLARLEIEADLASYCEIAKMEPADGAAFDYLVGCG